MYKTIILLLLSVWFHTAMAADDTRFKLPELRLQYLAASKDEAAAKEFHTKMEKYNGEQPVVLGYKAASEAVMAKYVWNPYYKMKHLKTALGLFDEAVALNNSHPEIRFLRFIVEYHVPRYLNMSENMEADKAIIIESLQDHPESGLNTALARVMRDVMLEKDRCNEEEKKLLKSLKI